MNGGRKATFFCYNWRMQIPVKTLKSGFTLPVYGLGTWGMGGWQEADASEDEKWLAAIHSALDHGITHLDTAELYGHGHAEELIGQVVKDYDRSKLLIASKVLAGMQDGYDGVMRAAHASAERLGTEIDLYMLHRYPAEGIEEIMRAVNQLLDEGTIKHIGVSNMTIPRMQKVQSLTDAPIVCNQLEYSLRMREADRYGVVEYCQNNDVFVTAWGPLDRAALEQGGILHEMAAKYAKTPYQVALNWLIAQPNVVTIPKTSSTEHLEENLGALGWELELADFERLTKEFPNQVDRSDRVSLDYAADVAP
ncbi:aldo/keto reductase [soil metagenome]